jgi:TonB family protein
MTVHTEFKLRYRKYFDIALALSLALHIVAFAVMPNLKIKAMSTETEEIEVIDIPPEIEIPPPPKEVARPKIPVETLDEDVEEEETIEDTTLDMSDLPDAPPPPPPSRGRFLVFDKAPKVKKYVKADYPTLAKQAEIEGIVRLQVTINERGRVIAVDVIDGVEILRAAAVEAMWQWEFEPAEQSGNPVKATITIPLQFTLNR